MKNLEELKKKLAEELNTLEAELKTVGRKNPSNPKDWEPVPSALDNEKSDPNDVADSIENYEENTAILKELEIRYNDVKSALKRIDSVTFGACEICKESIEEKRLIANPAATTCVKHMK